MDNALRSALGVLDKVAAGMREHILEAATDEQTVRKLEEALAALATMKGEVRAGQRVIDAPAGDGLLAALLVPAIEELAAHGVTLRKDAAPARARMRTPCPTLRAEAPERWQLIADSWGTWGCREHLFGMLHGMRSRTAPLPSDACRAEVRALMAEHDDAFPEHAPTSDAWVKT